MRTMTAAEERLKAAELVKKLSTNLRNNMAFIQGVDAYLSGLASTFDANPYDTMARVSPDVSTRLFTQARYDAFNAGFGWIQAALED